MLVKQIVIFREGTHKADYKNNKKKISFSGQRFSGKCSIESLSPDDNPLQGDWSPEKL